MVEKSGNNKEKKAGASTDDGGVNRKHEDHGVHFETLAANASHFLDIKSGAVVPPIQTSTTFARDNHYQLLNPASAYARDDSPGFLPAERVITDLENAFAGCLFGSGMAAISAVIDSLQGNRHVLMPNSLYWGVDSWLTHHAEKSGLRVSRYDNAEEPGLRKAIEALVEAGDKPDLVWVETPSNPLLHVTDLEESARLAHDAGALLCVDSTAATPVHTRPLDFGADLVVHSATKYLNGHSDALAGIVVTREESALWLSIQKHRYNAGGVPGSLESWLLTRGLRTLFLRVRQASSSAMSLAQMLDSRSEVTVVHYPGLPSHPGYSIACKQMHDGFGGLFSFELAGGRDAALQVAGALQLITSATSLGGTETLIEHRASVEPPGSGVPEGLLRLSTGIEQVGDLSNDLCQALDSL